MLADHRGKFCVLQEPLAADKIRTATTVIGVALGIAVVIAIQLTNQSSVRGFETALETVAGKTSVEIIGAGTGVDESQLPELLWLRAHGTVSPVIEGSAALVVGDVRELNSRRIRRARSPARPPATVRVRPTHTGVHRWKS